MKTRTQRGPGQAETEAETRVMLPAAKEHLGLPEAGGGRRAAGGSLALPTPGFCCCLITWVISIPQLVVLCLAIPGN